MPSSAHPHDRPNDGRVVTFSISHTSLSLPLPSTSFMLPVLMPPLAIDRSQYVTAPRGLSVSSGIPLLSQLVDAAHDPALAASPSIQESAKELAKLLAIALQADDALAATSSSAAGDPVLDQRADRRTKALNLRLQAATLLDDGEASERAADHLATLYPEGLAFIKSTYAAQDTVMQRMVRQLKDAELAKSVAELAGKEYLHAFKSVAKDYHAMVNAMGRVVPTTIDQRSIIVDMQTLIVQHASRVLGELRDAEPKSVARTRALLAPIDNYRARSSGSSSPRPPSPVTASDDDATSEAPAAAPAEPAEA